MYLDILYKLPELCHNHYHIKIAYDFILSLKTFKFVFRHTSSCLHLYTSSVRKLIFSFQNGAMVENNKRDPPDPPWLSSLPKVFSNLISQHSRWCCWDCQGAGVTP